MKIQIGRELITDLPARKVWEFDCVFYTITNQKGSGNTVKLYDNKNQLIVELQEEDKYFQQSQIQGICLRDTIYIESGTPSSPPLILIETQFIQP